MLPINPPPPLEIFRANVSPDGYFALSWHSDPGKIYRLQYRDDLGEADWTDLPGDVFSYGDRASKADPQPIRANPRFYRVARVR